MHFFARLASAPLPWGSRLRLAAGLVNERPATSRFRWQGIATEPVSQATRAEQAGSGFGDVLGGVAAVIAVILAKIHAAPGARAPFTPTVPDRPPSSPGTVV
jgi:hypothetical protein